MIALTEPNAVQATQLWVVDPARSKVEFRVPTFWGHSTVVGRFARFDGTYSLTPEGRTIELTIDAASLDTGNGLRDRHLREDDFFHVEAHPDVRFTADDVVEPGNGTLLVEGELQAAGKEVPLSFDATIRELGDELEIEATTTVDQRLLGMTKSPLGMLRTPSTLHVEARLVPRSG